MDERGWGTRRREDGGKMERVKSADVEGEQGQVGRQTEKDA